MGLPGKPQPVGEKADPDELKGQGRPRWVMRMMCLQIPGPCPWRDLWVLAAILNWAWKKTADTV